MSSVNLRKFLKRDLSGVAEKIVETEKKLVRSSIRSQGSFEPSTGPQDSRIFLVKEVTSGMTAGVT